MGDGILFLWDTKNLSETEIMNIVVSMYEICKKYKTDFLKEMEKKVVSPPQKLRCGIARGAIFSVGNGNDFVGPCINVSARLQKLHSLSFCFSRRGLKPEVNNFIAKELMTAKTDIRGIGSGELVCVLKSEYLSLSEEEKQNFLSI